LKSRPDPAFSMVTLRLQTTAIGRKIVWCYSQVTTSRALWIRLPPLTSLIKN
jgi:hypothetical protein